MTKRINRDSIRRSKEVPSTGDGQNHGRTPRHTETSGVPAFGADTPSRLRTGGWLPDWLPLIGKHRRRG